jgi:hypothetical protein
MNARSNIHEQERIRRDIGAALRLERDDVAEPAPQSLLVLLKDLETRVRDAEGERLLAEVDARVADLLRVAGGNEGCQGLLREPLVSKAHSAAVSGAAAALDRDF